ncbi:hemolysin family protein [bacterium]|nr:hemolysin family protein [bacterium]
MSVLELISCSLLIFLSAFASASEVAIFSLSRFQIRWLKDRARPSYRKLKQLMSDPDGLLITLLISNEVLNIALSTLIAESVSHMWEADPPGAHWYDGIEFLRTTPDWVKQMILGTLITTPIVLFACEITPKAIGARANQMIAAVAVGPLGTVYELLTPVRIVLKRLLSFVSKLFGQKHGRFHDKDDQTLLKEEEFLFMLEEGHKEGTVRQSEVQLIKNVFELDDTEVKSLYTPLSQVFSLPSTVTLKEALAHASNRKYSRIPVTGPDKKQVVGILHSKDLILSRLDSEPETKPVVELSKRPFVVSPTLKLSALFRKLKRSRTHLAVVENASGEALGIVTMDDILEIIFENVLPDLDEGDLAE